MEHHILTPVGNTTGISITLQQTFGDIITDQQTVEDIIVLQQKVQEISSLIAGSIRTFYQQMMGTLNATLWWNPH